MHARNKCYVSAGFANEHKLNDTCGTSHQKPEWCQQLAKHVLLLFRKPWRSCYRTMRRCTRTRISRSMTRSLLVSTTAPTAGCCLRASHGYKGFSSQHHPLALPSQPALHSKVDLGSTALARFRLSLPKRAADAFLGQNPMFTSQMDAHAAPSSVSLLEGESRHVLAKTGTGEHCFQFAKPLPSPGSCFVLQLPCSKPVGLARCVLVACASCCTDQDSLLKFCNTYAS